MAQGQQLDTSGAVQATDAVMVALRRKAVRWQDLSPFAQGYVEALFASLNVGGSYIGYLQTSYGELHRCTFRDLAPEALDMILRDCEVLARRVGYMTAADADMGALVWAQRQRGEISDFPPLRISLTEAGKVALEAEGGR